MERSILYSEHCIGWVFEGYSGGDARHVANFRLAARLRERRPASRKDWVTTLSPEETGRTCIIPPDSPKPRSPSCAQELKPVSFRQGCADGRRNSECEMRSPQP